MLVHKINILLVGVNALLSSFRVLLSDLLEEGHVHTNYWSLDLLGNTSLLLGLSINGTLLVQTTVDLSPVELGWLLLLVKKGSFLAGSEVKDLKQSKLN